jgi:hypothetical protein
MAKHKFTSYLEIGVEDGHNFHAVYCVKKVGVDPKQGSAATIKLTSDEFFTNNKDKFDVIFVDGLHLSEQIYKDVINSLESLNDNGFIICHDCLPEEESHQIREYVEGRAWTGDVWKGFVRLRAKDNIVMRTINTDWGCGIITKGEQEPLIIPESELTWDNYTNNKTKWMNIITVEEFLKLY